MNNKNGCKSPKNQLEYLADHSESPISSALILIGGWSFIIIGLLCITGIIPEFGRSKEHFWESLIGFGITFIIAGSEWLLGLRLQDKKYCATGYKNKRERRSEANMWCVLILIYNFIIWSIITLSIAFL